MALQVRWVGDEDYDQVALTRTRCYTAAGRELERIRGLLGDPHPYRSILLAERDGEAIGTATDLQLRIWMRSGSVACQGVAWVGTVKTARRRGAADERGVASRLMDALIERARERGDAVSALMPFRASFYEHFGYGLAETRHEWTVPLPILPAGDFNGLRYYRDTDLPALEACRQRICERGQCDIEVHPGGVSLHLDHVQNGFLIVDAPGSSGDIRGYIAIADEMQGSHRYARARCNYESIDGLIRQLHFLGSLKDQYTAAIVTLPTDVPLNWLLRESQIPHRPVDHPTAAIKPMTRMQIRILDHRKLLESMRLPESTRGETAIAIHEADDTVTRLLVTIEDGFVRVRASESTPEFECTDRVWASVVSGHLPATQAVQCGLAKGDDASAKLLSAFATGPAPFCYEYF